MAKYAFIGAIVLGAAIIGYVGCGGVQDRVNVVASKALKEIDNLIGDLDVQRQTVERKLNEVQKATLNVGEQHVRFQVQQKHALARQEALASEQKDILGKLETLKDLLGKAEESGAVTFKGAERTKDELTAKATSLLNKLKNNRAQSKQADTTVALATKNVNTLAKQKSVSKEQLAKLTGMIEKIDGQIKTLKAQRDAESIVSPGKDINTGFEETEASVKKLSDELEVQIAINDEKLEARIAELDASLGTEPDDLWLESKDDVSSTLSDIDKALQGE